MSPARETRVVLDEPARKRVDDLPADEVRAVNVEAGRWRFRLRMRAAATPPTPEEAVMIADAVVQALTGGDRG